VRQSLDARVCRQGRKGRSPTRRAKRSSGLEPETLSLRCESRANCHATRRRRERHPHGRAPRRGAATRVLPRGSPPRPDRGNAQTMADQALAADRPRTRQRGRPGSRSSLPDRRAALATDHDPNVTHSARWRLVPQRPRQCARRARRRRDGDAREAAQCQSGSFTRLTMRRAAEEDEHPFADGGRELQVHRATSNIPSRARPRKRSISRFAGESNVGTS